MYFQYKHANVKRFFKYGFQIKCGVLLIRLIVLILIVINANHAKYVF